MEPDDEVIGALKAGIAAHEATIARADAAIERMNRPPKPLEVSVEEPQNAAEVLAAATAKLEKATLDPTSSIETVRRLHVLKDRAAIAAAKEAQQAQSFSQMARSLDLRAQEARARDLADRKAQLAREESERNADEIKWGAAKRTHYVNG
jgi:hypothetical protein